MRELAPEEGARLAARIAAVVEGTPDEEVCGFVTADASGSLAVVPVRNVAGEGEDRGGPGKREAFLVDPVAHLRLERRLRGEGGRIAAVFHSHVDGPARLSASDLARSVVRGEPILPGVDWIVAGTTTGKISDIRIFRWNGNGWTESGSLPVGDRSSPPDAP